MNTVKFSFDVSTNTESNIECFTTINSEGTKIGRHCPLNKTHEFTIADIDTAEYEVTIKMSGKVDADTVLDGNKVVSSAELRITNFKFNDYVLDEIIRNMATYSHNCNGYGDATIEPFGFFMGYNGEVKFKFTTPIYLWLLENAN